MVGLPYGSISIVVSLFIKFRRDKLISEETTIGLRMDSREPSLRYLNTRQAIEFCKATFRIANTTFRDGEIPFIVKKRTTSKLTHIEILVKNVNEKHHDISLRKLTGNSTVHSAEVPLRCCPSPPHKKINVSELSNLAYR